MKGLLAIGLLMAGTAGQTSPTRNHVFVAPEAYVGRNVQVCGYVIYDTILASRYQRFNRTHGLAIGDGSPLPHGFRGQACVEGAIIELCGERQSICSEALFDHAITINRVLSTRPDPARR